MTAEAGPPLPVKEGDIIAGKYAIERLLGRGGMGTVVAARHLELHTRVAIKFLFSEAAKDADAVARFQREARAAVSLKSEHSVRVMDVGKTRDGTPYMVMELLVGSDLGALVDREGPLTVEDAVEYVLQACEAIAEAHVLGIVHRDLKPQNLFLTRRVDGRPLVKVLDFGLAKPLGTSALDQRALTQPAAMMGSPMYMSPEQMRAAKSVDARSDIWSLGVCLYELLTGSMPFTGTTAPELCASVLKDPPHDPGSLRPDLPEPLRVVLLRCLEKEPGARFRDVGAFALALEPFAPKGARVAAAHIRAVLDRTSPKGVLSPGPNLDREKETRVVERAGASTEATFTSSPRTGSAWSVAAAAAGLTLLVALALFLALRRGDEAKITFGPSASAAPEFPVATARPAAAPSESAAATAPPPTAERDRPLEPAPPPRVTHPAAKSAVVKPPPARPPDGGPPGARF